MDANSGTKNSGGDRQANNEKPKYENRFPYEASQGQLFPYEFIESMAEEALTTVVKWLKAKGLPDEVVDLVQDTAFLSGCSANFKHGDMSDATILYETMPMITKEIAELGGTFSSSWSSSNPRTPLSWQREPAKEA